MNMDEIKNRIFEFLRSENKTSAQFALEIGVQPSGISHIISGRNKPSLEFIVKMLSKYPALSTDWLIFGTGPMLRDGGSIELNLQQRENVTGYRDIFSDAIGSDVRKKDSETVKNSRSTDEPTDIKLLKSRTSRIVIFNDDGTFTEHYPG